jgi:AcrR family transcriptional regulator
VSRKIICYLIDATAIVVVSFRVTWWLIVGAVMKQWSEDNPKAALMQRKRALIVEAARMAFLEKGYAESSMGRIAEAAGVSIKTVYRHFENKDDLFSAVMHAACDPRGMDSLNDSVGAGASVTVEQRPWASKPPVDALPLAGVDYLQDLLSEERLSLYRVVARDAHRFPELGERYQSEVSAHREALFVAYLNTWNATCKWKIKDTRQAAGTFLALLRAGIFDESLLGLRYPDEQQIVDHARAASVRMLVLLEANCF